MVSSGVEAKHNYTTHSCLNIFLVNERDDCVLSVRVCLWVYVSMRFAKCIHDFLICFAIYLDDDEHPAHCATGWPCHHRVWSCTSRSTIAGFFPTRVSWIVACNPCSRSPTDLHIVHCSCHFCSIPFRHNHSTSKLPNQHHWQPAAVIREAPRNIFHWLLLFF